jgi:hypothetical protein
MKIHRQLPAHLLADLSTTGAGRSSCVHVSGIIRAMTNAYNPYPVSDKPQTPPARTNKFAIGFAWEYHCARHIPDPTFIHQPGEFMLDDIAMSPDGISLDPVTGGIILHEFKATWYSALKPVQEYQAWLWQIMAYLAGLSAHFKEQCLTAILHPMHMSGDYRENRYPIYAPVKLEFDWVEIETNWALMRSWQGRATSEEN